MLDFTSAIVNIQQIIQN